MVVFICEMKAGRLLISILWLSSNNDLSTHNIIKERCDYGHLIKLNFLLDCGRPQNVAFDL